MGRSRPGHPGARSPGLFLIGLTAATSAARAGADRSPRPDHPGGPAAGAKPLVITEPDTQTVLPPGAVEMDPARGPSTGDADRLEPNIDRRVGTPAR